ncbi:MAG: hypothetical protein K5978_04175 [Campylobacter sp.]|nr:hypothetical protein [Campylobacter sp.]
MKTKKSNLISPNLKKFSKSSKFIKSNLIKQIQAKFDSNKSNLIARKEI